jgi:hypothetical protein
MVRIPVTANSRVNMRKQIQPDSSLVATNAIMAAEISNLSAKGSKNFPVLVMVFCLRAICPSNKSVTDASMKMINATILPH